MKVQLVFRWRRAEKEFAKLLAAQPNDAALNHCIAGAMYNLAVGHIWKNDLKTGSRLLQDVVRHSTVAVRANQRNRGYSSRLMDALDVLGRIARQNRDFPEVMRRADQMVASNPSRGSCRIAAASLLAIALPVIEDGATRTRFAAKAMGHLRHADASKFGDPRLLKRHPHLANLKQEQGYADLIARLVARRARR